MIKQLFTKKRLTSILLIFELVVIIAAFILSYTTNHKMGMQRHMIYLNYKVEERVNVDLVKFLILTLLIAFIINVLYSKIKLELKTLWTIVLILISFMYILFIKKDINRSYYYISLLLFLGSIFQFIIYKLSFKN